RQGSRRARRRAPLRTRSSRAQLLEHDGVDLLEAVDALFEVFRAGPARERRLEVALVAETRETLAQLVCERVVDSQPFLARRPAEEGVVKPAEARQLADRLGVVVDAQVDQD